MNEERWVFCVYMMECPSVVREKDILPFVTTWVGAEGTVLSAVSQIEKDIYWVLFIWGVQRSQTHKNRPEWWFPRDGGWGEAGQRCKL